VKVRVANLGVMVLRAEDRHVPVTVAVYLVSLVDPHEAVRVREKVKARYVTRLTIVAYFSVFQVKYIACVISSFIFTFVK
jgi:hypothetical protein